MQNGRIQSVVFDFDGTLAELHLDFSEMKRRVVELASEYLDVRLQPSGQPALELLETIGSTIQARDHALAQQFRDRAHGVIMVMELEAAARGALFPFTRRVLHLLGGRGIKTAVITRNCQEAVTRVFPDIRLHCAAFLSRDHVERVKPDPRHLLQALDELAMPAATALMVGDHPLDIQTGKRAGTLTAGVATGNTAQSDLFRCGADWTARNCEELVELLVKEGRLQEPVPGVRQ